MSIDDDGLGRERAVRIASNAARSGITHGMPWTVITSSAGRTSRSSRTAVSPRMWPVGPIARGTGSG